MGGCHSVGAMGKHASAHFWPIPLAFLAPAGRDCPPYPFLDMENHKVFA